MILNSIIGNTSKKIMCNHQHTFEELRNRMKILFLGYVDSSLLRFIKFLKDDGNHVIITDKKIDMDFVNRICPNFIISYGYRFIITEDIITKYDRKAINLHISYLPYNRGADPNLWSFIDNTQKGVSIHYIDKGIDTGDIIVQREIPFAWDDTLNTMYNK